MTEKDAAIFFGRTAQVTALTEKVRLQRCVFVLGTSGAGKSSLVWAGLIPNLIDRNAISGSNHWVWQRFTPGEQGGPRVALARVLTSQLHRSWEDKSSARLGYGRISRLVLEILATRPKKAELLLFIDQFEELFTLVSESSERAAFIDVLAKLVETRYVRVVATMRAEFLGHCTKSEDFGVRLAAWFTAGNFWLSAPNADDLREMITGPAQRAGLKLAEGLVERIVSDTGTKPGNLPLMAFALERLFRNRKANGSMTATDYTSFGGVKRAIADRASSVFQALLHAHASDAEIALSEVFKGLVEVDENSGTPVRRRMPVSHLPTTETARRLIDEFVNARLLVRGAIETERFKHNETDGEAALEVAHEALFQNWPQLANWIEQRKGHFVLRQQLARDAREWQAKKRLRAYSWSDERALDAAVMIRELRHQPSPLEKEFLGPIELGDMLQRIEAGGIGHEERASIGIRLDLLGDPRPGVGLRSDGLPDIEWLRVSAGEVPRAGAAAVEIQEFWIAQYPITYSQYRAFINDRDGYGNDRWWADLSRSYTEPGDQFPRHNNHPAVNVLWSEAVAFCRWLSAKADHPIRLPTEWEWRFAATGGRKLEYPWGDTWRDDAANTEFSRLNRSTAVGLFPQGKSQVGAYDMAGNVWEWCLNEIGNANKHDVTAVGNRATLGGSWNSTRQDTVVEHSGGYDLRYRNLNTGFRVIRVG